MLLPKFCDYLIFVDKNIVDYKLLI